MKTLSMDLRERVGKAKGTGSSYEVAKRFAVHDSWVRRLWLRLKHTGSVALMKRGGKRARKIDPEGEQKLRQWLKQKPDLTVEELRRNYRKHREVEVSEPTMRRTLKRMGMSRKKRHFSQRSSSRSESL